MKIAKIRDVKTPQRGTPKSAGLDFFIPNDFPTTTIKPTEAVRVGSGIKVEIPENHVLIAFNKSGVALNGLQVGAQVIDEDYQGEINLHLYNRTNNEITVTPGQKLTQFILLPVVYCDVELVDITEIHLQETVRGEGGFASTGTH